MEKFQKLSRTEMKRVKGGKLPNLCTWSGTCTNFPGTQGDPDEAQAAADAWCEAADCCTNVDCPGAA